MDNINITVNETIENVVVNPSITTETIDVNLYATTETVDISITPNLTTVNINTVTGGGLVTSVNGQVGDVVLNIPANTSDLINDGEDGINPFITLNDIPVSGLTSVGLTMPVAFNVANSPLTSDGTIAVSAAGTSSQYIRGDGQLATLPTGAGGGSTVAYYLNGSINASVAGYKQLSNTATIGGGTDFTLAGNGLIAQFLTDLGNPNRLEIPGGAWNFEMYFQASSAGGNQKFYVELLKYNGTTFTSIASTISVPEEITGGTAIDLYLTSLAVPTTTLLVTDRLAIQVYIVDNSGGRTITLHTEDNTLCEIITTFSGGVTSLNGLTANTQYLAVGTTGTDFNISSLTDTHTFNLPTASATNRGALSTTDWTAFNGKFNLPSLTSGSVLFSNGTTIAQDNSNFFWDDTNNRLGIGTNAPVNALDVRGIITTTTSTVGNMIVLNGANNTNLTLLNDSGGRSFLTVKGNTSATSAAGAYFTAEGYQEAWFNVIARAATAGNQYWRFGNIGSGIPNNIFAIQKLNDTGTAIVSTPFAIQSSTSNVLINTTTDQGGKLQIKAPGALSTDIALRVRNSADTFDLMTVNGLGNVGVGVSTALTTLQVNQLASTTKGIFISGDEIYATGNGSTAAGVRIALGVSRAANRQLWLGDNDAFGSATLGIFRLTTGTTGYSGIDAVSGNGLNRLLTLIGTETSNVGIGNNDSGNANTSLYTGKLTTFVFNESRVNLLLRKSGTGTGDYINAVNTSSVTNFVVKLDGTTGIGTGSPTASAILQADSTTKGFLPPRMTNAQRIAIATPAVGLCVYCTDVVEGLYINKSTGWTFIG